MRIRSIKPEFWSSEDIALLDWPTRLLFIGLWSYVDDNGVGRDNEKLIKADLFPLEDDPRETLATVSRGLQALCDGGQITRYIVDGRPFLHITAWESHQRIDRPNKPRYPLPTCENAVPRDTLASMSRHPREDPLPGAGEQGNRGTEEQRTYAADAAARPASAELVVTPTTALAANPPTSQTLIGEWIDHCAQPPPARVKGQIAKEVKAMLEEGIAYDRVRAGLAEWNSRGLHPSTLASVVHEVANKAARRPNNRQQETDDLFDAAMQRALERDGSHQ